MQGAAALDLIGHDQPAAARAPDATHAPPALAHPGGPLSQPLGARPHKPEHHGPSVVERELGEALHPDRNAQLGHPGLDCSELPPGHAHRLPQCKAAHDLGHPVDAEAPLLVDTSAGATGTTGTDAP